MKANIRNWEKGLRPPVYRVFQISLPIFFISSTYFVKYRHDDDFWRLDNKAIFLFDKSRSMLCLTYVMINLIANFIKEYIFLQKFLLLSQFG